MGLGEGDYVIVDGTLIPTDRIAADEPYYNQKHKRHGMNVPVIAAPDGTPLWFSRAPPGRTHDLTAARAHGIVQACLTRDIPVLADRAYQGAGATVRTPYKRHHEQPAHYQQFNRDHARLRAPGEHAFARLKQWRVLRKARCSTNRMCLRGHQPGLRASHRGPTRRRRPRALADRGPAPHPRHHLPRGRLPDTYRKRTPRPGHPPQPRDRPGPPRRLDQPRRWEVRTGPERVRTAPDQVRLRSEGQLYNRPPMNSESPRDSRDRLVCWCAWPGGAKSGGRSRRRFRYRLHTR
ncbi:DDE superfamily endonuclease [Streptomyces yunnanensis]|uniref:DDE superfamily endonuclease n=1 Tax=Streptomyces yunnanensis TaxID=156453 RepID=A0A9X8R0I1_9ACTN|nr:DDE superfamily endonuclease [Streptomyces yunnanensis]